MRLTCLMGDFGTKVIEVDENDELNVLMGKLDLTDKNTKFVFKGQTYAIFQSRTFKDIGLISDTNIFINNQAISGEKYIND